MHRHCSFLSHARCVTGSGSETPAKVTFVEAQESKDVLSQRNRTHFEHHGFLLLFVNRDVGAVNPGVGAEVPEPHIGVPERKVRNAPA